MYHHESINGCPLATQLILQLTTEIVFNKLIVPQISPNRISGICSLALFKSSPLWLENSFAPKQSRVCQQLQSSVNTAKHNLAKALQC